MRPRRPRRPAPGTSPRSVRTPDTLPALRQHALHATPRDELRTDRRAASRKPDVVEVGSAYPESASQAPTTRPSATIPGTSSAISAGPTTWLGMPRLTWAATLARSAPRAAPAPPRGSRSARTPGRRPPPSPPSRGSRDTTATRAPPRPQGRSASGRTPTSGRWPRRRRCRARGPGRGRPAGPGGRRGWRPGPQPRSRSHRRSCSCPHHAPRRPGPVVLDPPI